MPGRRGSRFALEVAFLVALAIGLTVAEERPLVIAGVMALGWLLVALAEWALWRDEPHYASGLPPRWYVPRVNLPPAQPLDPVVSGYPEGRRDEAPTWIATPALRSEMLGEWPHAVAVGDEPAVLEGMVVEGTAVEVEVVESEVVEHGVLDTGEAGAGETDRGEDLPVEPDAWTIVELPPHPLEEPPTPVARPDSAAEPEPQLEQPAVEYEPVGYEAVEHETVEHEAFEQQPVDDSPVSHEPVAVSPVTVSPEAVPEAPAEPGDELSPEEALDLDVELTRSAGGTARYSLDPLAEAPRRRFGRRGEDVPSIAVPARPEGVRVLPFEGNGSGDEREGEG